MELDDRSVAMRIYNFDKDLEVARPFEYKFGSWIAEQLDSHVEYAPDGIFEDWDVKCNNDTFEVKYDRWLASSQNIIVETHSDLHQNSLGWFYTTKAKWLIVFYNETEFIMMPMEHLRDVWFDCPSIWTRKDIQ